MSFGICIPPNPPPSFSTSYTFSLSTVPTGSYTVRAYYDTQLSSSTAPLNVQVCCPNLADAGNDTSLCDQSSLQLNANTLTGAGTGSWSILSGGGTLSSTTISNPTLTFGPYGVNELVWTTIDTFCTTSDTLFVTNSQTATTAIAESDRIACEDTTTVQGNTPAIGNAKWTSTQLGVLFPNGNAGPNTFVKFLVPNSYKLYYTIENGACISKDSANFNYTLLDSAPVITESNFLLTSSSAPQYQWYLDGNPINGATNQTHQATVNGVYKVLASLTGCTTGLFSNEIELTNVGFEEFARPERIKIFPNPAQTSCTIDGLKQNETISLFTFDMRRIEFFNTNRNSVKLDLSDRPAGIYFIQIQSSQGVITKKLIVE